MAGEDNRVYGFRKLDAEQLIQVLGSGKGENTLPGTSRSVNYIAMTPGGGIAARSGTTISSANCTVYSGEGGTLTSAGIEVPIYNLSTTAISGSTYVVPVWAGGVLIATEKLSEASYQYELTTNWTGGMAIATRKTMDGVANGGSVLVRDPLSIFSYQKRGDKGYMLHKVAEDKYYAIQAPCQSNNAPPPEDPVGACCLSDEEGVFCIVTTPSECEEMQGVYKGDGTDCETSSCP